jgi:FAD-dependent oxidoreductase domain-containing protein 1
MAEYDVLVVGAGILGLSTAYHIKLKNPKLRILIVDKNVGAGLGSTVNSAAAFRCFFSSSANFDLSDSSVDFYKHLQKDLGYDLKMRSCGYLWAFTKKAYERILPVLAELKGKGLNYQEYMPTDLTRILGMNASFVEEEGTGWLGAVYRAIFIPKAGVIGVMSLVHFYESEFLRLGGEIHYRTEVSKFLVEPDEPLGLLGEPQIWQHSKVTGVETSMGTIRSKKTVVAAGPWLSQLLDTVGMECFVKPRKRQVFSVKANTDALKKLLKNTDFSKAGCLPFTVLAEPSVYLRPNLEGELFGIGYADDFPRAFRLEEHPKPEADFYQNSLYPVVSKYFPQFDGAVSSGGFAGLYEITTLDEHPVIFEDHDVIVVGGGSGSGIMKADAIGRIAAAVYEQEDYATLYGEKLFKVSDLSLKNRAVETEKLII